MKYTVVFLGILLVAFIPATGGAQGFPAGGGLASLGLPSLGGLLGGGCAPGCDPKAGGGLGFDIGYLATSRNVAFDFTSEALGLGGVQDFRQRYGLNGLWLALLANGQLADGVGVFARGSWLVPSNRQSDEEYNTGGDRRNWQTNVQWYNADLGGTYSPYGAFAVIGGFRFDSFSTSFKDPIDPTFANSLNTDEADVTVTSYVPYVGLMMNPASVRVGLIGFPYVPGSVKYNQTIGGAPARFEASGSFRTSYFLEAFAEYGREFMGGSVGIFGIWTYLHATSNVDLSAQPFTVLTQPFQFAFDRQNWIFGGKFAVNFVSPI